MNKPNNKLSCGKRAPRGLMFSEPPVIVELAKGRESMCDLTIRVIPSQQPNKKGPTKPPFGPPGTLGLASEPVKLLGKSAGDAVNPAAYTVEYHDHATRTLPGEPPNAIQRRGFTWAKYVPSVCLRLEYKILKNETRRLAELTDALVKRAAPHMDLAAYLEQWDVWNAKRGYPAASNPLVWFIWFAVTRVRA